MRLFKFFKKKEQGELRETSSQVFAKKWAIDIAMRCMDTPEDILDPEKRAVILRTADELMAYLVKRPW